MRGVCAAQLMSKLQRASFCINGFLFLSDFLPYSLDQLASLSKSEDHSFAERHTNHPPLRQKIGRYDDLESSSSVALSLSV